MQNPITRTLQIVQVEYHNLAAIIGEKVGQIKNLEAEIEQHALALKHLSVELIAHKSVDVQVAEKLAQQETARLSGQVQTISQS